MAQSRNTMTIMLGLLSIFLAGLLLLQVTEVIDIKYDLGNTITGNFVKEEVTESEEDLVEKCKSDNLEYAVRCIMDEVDKFYKYNQTDDKISLTYNQLKEQGGDCYNYARFYERVGESMDFRGDMHFIDVPNENNHVFATITSSDGYCILDGQQYKCYEFKKEE